MTDPGAQARDAGLAAAAAVVQRMLDLGRSMPGLQVPLLPDRPLADTDPSGDPAARVRRFRADADRLVDAYGEATRLLLDAALDLATGSSPPAGEPADPDVLVLGPVGPGATTEATIWLHVLDGPPAAPATLHATELTSHDGTAIAGGAVSFDPPVAETAALRASTAVTVTVDVPAGCPDGTFHGHVLAKGLPELVLPVRLEVAR